MSYPGVQKRVSITVTNEITDALANATLTLTLLAPNGTTSSPSATNDSTGHYHVDVTCSLAGEYALRVVASGALVGVGEVRWEVDESAIPS